MRKLHHSLLVVLGTALWAALATSVQGAEDQPLPQQRAVLGVRALAATAQGTDDQSPRVFTEATHGPASLAYHGDVPVAVFAGTPTEIGRQHAALLAPQTKPIGTVARRIAADRGFEVFWPMAVRAADALLDRAPERFRQEIAAASESADVDADAIRVFNTGLELRRLGCSTLIVEPAKSATGGLLFGRNFDFPPLGVLDKYGLVMVYRPEGHRPFVSIGFPGMVGVFSGMNDAGLTVATLDVYATADGSQPFDGGGEPLAIVFRRILEECESVDEAESLLKSVHATTWTNLAVCDRQRGAVFEITPKQVVRRDGEGGLLPCTNHFRSPELVVPVYCRRYEQLSLASNSPKLTIDDLQQRLNAANQGWMTVQTMIFEPATLTVHLAMGPGPISAKPLAQLDLAPLFQGSTSKDAEPVAAAAFGE